MGYEFTIMTADIDEKSIRKENPEELVTALAEAKSVDYGRMDEILVQRAASPDEFICLTAITWINEFVKLGGDQLVLYYADILGTILPGISDKKEKIRVVALETNEELWAINGDPNEGFDVGGILSVARKKRVHCFLSLSLSDSPSPFHTGDAKLSTASKGSFPVGDHHPRQPGYMLPQTAISCLS